MKEEIFKEIQGFERYQISNHGRVVCNYKNKSKFLKPQKDAMGYLHVRLYKDDNSLGRYKNGLKKAKLEKVHRLVAQSFIEIPDDKNYYEINHIDCDKTNNFYKNLEWVTRSQNIQHSYKVGNRAAITEQLQKMKRQGVKLTRLDGSVEYYVSVLHCALSNNVSPPTISMRLVKQDKGAEPSYGKLGFKVVRCDKPPKGEKWLMLAGIEEKLLIWRQKYYGSTEELREKRRKYARAFRARQKQKKQSK